VAKRKAKSTKAAKSRRRVQSKVPCDDGAAWALFGYLHQFIGSAACRLERLGDHTASDPLCQFETETHGQDLVRTNADEIHLIQFKFSRDRRNIPPSELADILRKLEQSEAALLTKGKAILWFLRSNRSLGNISQALVKNDPSVKLGKTTPADAALIRRIGSRLAYQFVDTVEARQQLILRAKKFGVTNSDHLAASVNEVTKNCSRLRARLRTRISSRFLEGASNVSTFMRFSFSMLLLQLPSKHQAMARFRMRYGRR
jgi:hypothetical protein